MIESWSVKQVNDWILSSNIQLFYLIQDLLKLCNLGSLETKCKLFIDCEQNVIRRTRLQIIYGRKNQKLHNNWLLNWYIKLQRYVISSVMSERWINGW